MMTPLQRSEIRRYLEDFNFSALFTDSTVGWDWPVQSGKLRVPHQGSFVELETVAEKRGVKVLLVPADASGDIISSDDRKKLEKAVTPLATEHLLIFTDARKGRQVWLWTSRWPGKPISYRELIWEKDKANELLLQKLSSIAFTLDEEDALDITGVVLRLRDSLDRDKVTKRFYDQFKTHKDAFRKFIKGITDASSTVVRSIIHHDDFLVHDVLTVDRAQSLQQLAGPIKRSHYNTDHFHTMAVCGVLNPSISTCGNPLAASRYSWFS